METGTPRQKLMNPKPKGNPKPTGKVRNTHHGFPPTSSTRRRVTNGTASTAIVMTTFSAISTETKWASANARAVETNAGGSGARRYTSWYPRPGSFQSAPDCDLARVLGQIDHRQVLGHQDDTKRQHRARRPGHPVRRFCRERPKSLRLDGARTRPSCVPSSSVYRLGLPKSSAWGPRPAKPETDDSCKLIAASSFGDGLYHLEIAVEHRPCLIAAAVFRQIDSCLAPA